MSLFGSLYAGVSGLTAQSRAMGMISDNIANVNTTAYKGAQAQFSTLVTQSRNASSYSPGGVRAQAFQTIASQGLIQSTNSTTDAAIDGNGFFVVNSEINGEIETFYTRAGSFTTDLLGNMRTPSGHFLQGWALDANEEIIDVNALQNVNVGLINGLAAATTAIDVRANLNADQAPHLAPAWAAGAMADNAAPGGGAGVAPHSTRPVKVYDSLGRPHDLTLAFLKDGGAVNTWRVELFADPADVAPVHVNGSLASGTITFNNDGSLAAVDAGLAGPLNINWPAADGAAPSAIALDFGTPGLQDGLTQFQGETDFKNVTQNGAEVGTLRNVSIDERGFVIGSFTNNEQRKLYQLPIATFANPAALDPRSGNIYAQTDASGEFNLRQAGTAEAGEITPSALESANVDLADEFTKMIVTQRAYSANAKVITTSDEMLDELIRLRR